MFEDTSVLEARFNAKMEMEYTKRYNAAPSQALPIIKDDRADQIVGARWGLVPYWAKTKKSMRPQINARAETVAQRPAFREAFAHNRCLVLASSFFEWDPSTHTPYLFRLKSRAPFAFAGIFEENTFAIITTESNEVMEKIHHRMPVMLRPKDEHVWLDPTAGAPQLQSLLSPYSASEMEFYEVSRDVNRPIHDERRILDPVSG